MHLDFLYTAVSWVLLRWHQLFTLIGLKADSGLNWSLSIIFLVITARLLLFRFFVKQVHYQRKMQEMQPRLNALKVKYKDDKQAQQREMMRLQQEEGFNPIAGCLPMFLQIPVFIGLFHVLKHIANSVDRLPGNSKLTLYTFTESQTYSAAHARLFGSPLASSLLSPATIVHKLGGDLTSVRIVTPILVIVSAAATFFTQRLVKSSATTVPVGSAATIQRLMTVFIPVSVLGSGIYFPLGVLLYWFTSNLWTLGQQAYIIKYHPHTPSSATSAAPGSVGKSLAPRPGAKPSLDKRRTTMVVNDPAGDDGFDDNDGSVANGTATLGPDRTVGDKPSKPKPGAKPAAPRPSTPPAGARSTRPGAGNRPNGNRPNKSKKRR